jgi:hypothetical protein
LLNNAIKYADSVDDKTKPYVYETNLTHEAFITALDPTGTQPTNYITISKQDDEHGIIDTNFNITSLVLTHTIASSFTPSREDLNVETDDFNKTVEL